MIINHEDNKIDWLILIENKLIKDERGFLWEIIPWWNNNPLINWKIGHIYASVATWKHIPRWWHYHHKNIDRFSLLSWSCLCLFIDYRNDNNNVYSIILWNREFKNDIWIANFTIDKWYMITVIVPTWVHHTFIPLTDEVVNIVSIASEAHDDNDYVKISPFEITQFSSLLESFWIKK